MNIFEYNNVIYKGNVNYYFYLFCLKKNPKIIKYLFINVYYFIISLIFKKKSNIYIINKYRYLKDVTNLKETINEFYSNKRINNYISDKKDIIIDRVPYILIDKTLANKVIGYKLDSNYKVLIDEYNKEINEINNCNKLFIRNNYELLNIHSDNIYVVNNNRMHYIGRRKKRNKLLVNLVIILILSIILTCISFCFSFANLDLRIYITYFEPKLFFINFLPIFLIILLLTFILRRVNVSFLITSVFIMLLGISNQTKALYRDDVVKFEDLTLLKEASIMSTKYSIVIKKYTILSILLIIVLYFLLKRYLPKIKINLKKQIILIILSSLLIVFNYKLIYCSDKVYDSVGNTDFINTWLNTQKSQIRGLVYPFINSINEYNYTKPDNYNEKQMEEKLKTYTYMDIPSDKKVNIISIMFEAYNDFSKYDNIDFNYDVYELFHDIEENSLYGNIVTKIFGGGTINTERNFLTGYYNLPSFRNMTNSYVWYFKEQGYNTEAFHPIYGSFYNRITAFDNLGFDNYYNYENKFSSIQESFLEDNEFFDYIIEGYENNKKTNKPYFSFSVTYQNHGPYEDYYYPDKVYYINNSGYTEETYNTVSEYFYGIKKTNDAIKKLIDFFDNEKEPVIIILFGDHNPYLGENGYSELGINLDLSTIDGFLNYYETPYVIHANDSAKLMFDKNFVGKSDDISAIFLMNELFDYLDLKGNSYMQYMNELKNRVSVISDYFYKENNNYILKEDSIYKDLVDEYYSMNYYYSNYYK